VPYLLLFIGRAGLAYGIGAMIILVVALIVGIIGRHINESKPERQQEDAEAAALVDQNAEVAGWGPPRQRPMSGS
jgi:hypothetical protein